MERRIRLERECGNTEQAAAVSSVALAVLAGMFVRRATVVVTERRAVILVMMFAVARMRMGRRFRRMNMRGYRTFCQAMRGGAAAEGQCGMRRENAQRIERNQRKRRFESKSFGQADEHCAVKDQSATHRNPVHCLKDKV